MATELGVAYLSIVPETSKIAPGVKKALGDNSITGQADRSGKSMGSRLTDGMGKAMKTGAKVAGAGLLGVLGTALYKGFGRLKGIEEAQAKLKGLGHSTKTVETVMKNALGAVKGTAFGLQDAATVAAGTVAAGIKPGKDLEKTLTLVGDAATIAGTDLGTMGSIFNKVAASNKIQGDVIAQLNDAGIPIIQLLGKELGTSAEETVKLASAGKINFATFQTAMEKGLGGAAQKSGQTMSGAFANMQAALGRLGASLLGGVFSKLPNLFGGITAKLDKLGPVAERVGKLIGRAFSSLAKSLQPVVKRLSDVATAMGKRLAPVAERVFKFMKDNPKVVKAFAIALGVLAAAIGVVTVATTLFSIALNSTGIPLVIIGIAALVAGLVYAYQKSEKFRTVVNAVGRALRTAGTWMRDVLLPAVVDLAGKIKDNLEPVIAAIITKFQEWWPSIQKVIVFVATLVQRWAQFYAWAVGKVFPIVVALIQAFVRGLGPAIGQVTRVLKVIIPVISAVVGAIIKIIGKIAEFGTALLNGGKDARKFATAVAAKIGEVVMYFMRLPARVIGALGNFASILWGVGQAIMQSLWNGLKDKWEDVKDWFGGVTDLIPNIKGPAARDRILLRPAGRLVMQGFREGLVDGERDVLAQLRGTTDRVGSLRASAPVLATTGSEFGASGRSPANGLSAEAFATALRDALHGTPFALQIGREAAGTVYLVGQNVRTERA